MATKVYLCGPNSSDYGDSKVAFSIHDAILLFRANDHLDFMEIWERGKGKTATYIWDEEARNFATERIYEVTMPSNRMLAIVTKLLETEA